MQVSPKMEVKKEDKEESEEEDSLEKIGVKK